MGEGVDDSVLLMTANGSKSGFVDSNRSVLRQNMVLM